MGGPWEEYQNPQDEAGPWTEYQSKPAPEQPKTAVPDILTNAPASGFLGSLSRSSPAIAGGIAGGMAAAPYGAPFGPVGMALAGGAGALMGGAAAETGRQGLVGLANAYRGQPQSSAGEIAQNINREGISQGAGYLAGEGIGAGIKAALPAAIKVGAQGMRVLAGIPERAGIAALKDPPILTRALPIEEAGQAYSAATGGLESGAKAARETLGKSYFSGEAIANKFDELAPSLADGTIDTQTALALRQRTMKAIQDLPFNQKDLKRVLADNIDQLDTVLEKRLPNWEGARTGYKESKIAEEFSSLLPLNKNLSPNVLRTTAAIAAAGKGLVEGRPYLALGLPMISPKVYGTAIKGAALAGNIPGQVYRVMGQAATSGSASSLYDAYNRQRSP